MATSVSLELAQSLFTNGSRAAAVYFTQACYFLAIPQFAQDIPGGEASMHGGDSNVSLMLYRTSEGSTEFQEYQQLDVPGGEDAEFFTIDGRTFLATACERTGSDPTYSMDVESCIFEWVGDQFSKFQCMPTFGAKQWRAFDIDGRHFLALAQGDQGSGFEPTIPVTNSTIYEWDGSTFQTFQTVPSVMGYNWLHFSLDGREFLAYADHVEPSYVLEWKQDQFVHFQTLDGVGGRAMHLFENKNRTLMAFARMTNDSLIYEWGDQGFQQYQTLSGAGGREFALIEDGGSQYLILLKMLTGTVTDPVVALNSTIYRVDDDGLNVVSEFPTLAGTDISTFSVGDANYVVVADSMTEDLHFRQDSYVYRFVPAQASQEVAVRQDNHMYRSVPETGPEPPSGCPMSKNKPRAPTPAPAPAPVPAPVPAPAPAPAPAPRSGCPMSKRSPYAKRQDAQYISPEFQTLFNAFTGSDTSIGSQYQNASTTIQASNPLIVGTAEDIIFYPGDGGDPAHLPYRYGTAGFIEITSTSHLGPAIGALAGLYALDPEGQSWRDAATNLLNATTAARGANSPALWRDQLQVPAWEGRETSISDMVSYACDVTIRLLDAVLADPTKLSYEFLRDNYFNSTGGELGATIPMNSVMTATFFLEALNQALEIKTLLDQHEIDWTKLMVLIDGQLGRETAGVVMSSNTLAQTFLKLHPELPVDRIYIAPNGLVPNVTDTSPDGLRVFEPELRLLWGGLRGLVTLAGNMFAGFPAYQVATGTYPVINATTPYVSDLPAISGPDDYLALTTRIRVTLEDPRQPLSGSVADFAGQSLYDAGGNATKVVVPGLDGYDYASALQSNGTTSSAKL
ncbi:hypothetical protein SLS62_002589 [Diatrype stigma]|uniref:DUF5624 domain-containing protein n=1 Tax=Diatrype stigma TaxID=117547 RepID=A0AAN9V8A4_9PEZI